MNQVHTDPLDPQRAPPTPFRISPQDQKVIQECNREAFYKRCLPISAGFGGLTFLAARAGFLKSHATWGPTPKVMAAVFLGYFVGKISYQQICAEKLMAIPDSPLGAALRARKQQGGGGFQDSLTLDMPGYSLPEEGSPDVYRDDSAPRTFTDLDTDRPYNQGLDDTFRLNVDSLQRPEDFVLPPQATIPKSYDELRRQNREEYDKKSRSYRPAEDTPRQYQPPAPQPPPSSGGEPFDRYKPTNIYGDIFEK
uniref:OCIA domain-containing protein n=1 Tax=Graphocephala atropunctata TaxID=36148 RepID=A0A1B6M6S9_9HEMI